MEVWVRSQDKENFLPIRGLRYKREEYKKTKQFGDFAEETQLFCDYDIVVKHYIYSDYYVDILGEYSTKERCLEIIDEIQKILMSNGMILFKNIDISEIPKEALKPFKALAYLPNGDNQSSVSVHNAEVVVYEMPKE